MPPLPDQGTVDLARMSYATRVSTTHSSALAMSTKGGDAVEVTLGVNAIGGVTLLVTIQEGDDLTTWAPLGLAQAISAVGPASVSQSGIAKKYVRVLLEAAGTPGEAALVQVTVTLRRS